MTIVPNCGQVLTFYSYKGGTGRTMALANIACVLAQREANRVLMIDFDLEAPGLHRYFPEALQKPNRGAMELMETLFLETESLEREEEPRREKRLSSIIADVDIEQHVRRTRHERLSLMSAGDFENYYGPRVAAFDWERFYIRAPELMRLLAEKLGTAYTHILVDSRTGLNDISGICTAVWPEKLVVVFTPNEQNLSGAVEMVQQAISHRRQSDDLRPLLVYPIPSRIENAEPTERDLWRLGKDAFQGYQQRFEDSLADAYALTSCDLTAYFDDVQFQHVPFYSYGEKIAVELERSRDVVSLASAYDRFVEWLERAAPPWAVTKYDVPKIAVSRLPSSPFLIGRERELAMLDAAWSGDAKKNVVTIVAFGGVGKSTLAAHWAATKMNDVERYFDWSFHRQGSSDVFLKAALEFFGDAALAASAADGWQKGERLAQLVSQHRTLLILDGLEPLQDAKTGELRDPALTSLLRGLAQRNGGLCVVTTRQEIPDIDVFRGTTAPQWKLAYLSKEAGASLLESLGVQGTATERETLAGDVKGHALTLTLLGKFLAEAHGGDIRRRDLVSLHEADSEETSGHAFRVMEAYEEGLARDGRHVELAILRLLGLFDRPATPDCLGALREAPAIDGLTDSLVTLTDAQWNLAVKRLVQLGFVEEQPWEPPRIAGYSEEEARRMLNEHILAGDAQPPQPAPERRMAGNALDAHPLIREHFARRLRESASEAWLAAHGRLYEYLRDTVPYWPEEVDGLQPLYQAVVHGCQAGRAAETLEQVYHARIQRGTSGPYAFYSTTMLGLIGADLAAVRSFFTVPWKQVAADLTVADQGWLLNLAASRLRASGRLDEAREPMRAALEIVVALEHWKNAAMYAANLSELDLTLGDVVSAVRHAEQSVQHADRNEESFGITAMRTTYADALHQAGRVAEAAERFREAETLQRNGDPTTPLLYSLRGVPFCDLLLAETERACWRRCLGSGEQSFDVQTLAEVEHRATTALALAMRNQWLLAAALDNLTLGRVEFFRAILGTPPLDSAHSRLEAAVQGLRQAGAMHHLPRALLTRAWLRVLQGNPAAARADLDEAQQIAERGPMRLFLADVHLHRARLFFRENRDEAREELKKARALIERCGYHRRDEELRDAEAVI
jgi:cellulose biosynthesis protein BcsQ/tetratricopeptide (TPR) repeat protein